MYNLINDEILLVDGGDGDGSIMGNVSNRTGTNQTYDGNGQDSGGGMMKAGGSTGGYH